MPVAIPPPNQRGKAVPSGYSVAALILVLAALGWWIARGRSSTTALDEFWSPVLNGTRAGLGLRRICSGLRAES